MDPGGVRTSIWDAVPLLSRPPARWVIETLYAPPSDGAEVLVRAATVPWEQVGGGPGGRRRSTHGIKLLEHLR